jgi:phenolic acid decarboxylase
MMSGSAYASASILLISSGVSRTKKELWVRDQERGVARLGLSADDVFWVNPELTDVSFELNQHCLLPRSA